MNAALRSLHSKSVMMVGFPGGRKVWTPFVCPEFVPTASSDCTSRAERRHTIHVLPTAPKGYANRNGGRSAT
ncbi:hypothetical protein L210DRAFT_946427 [Boletus edulis BED1]|uniref:Uncharacterized protein n=1 Tax=Boletus edulis BED1 TaxID=1328754 RepID=A0AAD4BF98_BOLED|nr:hypothetical protein L210DRAFT_946427 [Boletus edulis BED1]